MDYVVILFVCLIFTQFIAPPIENYFNQRMKKGWRRWLAVFAVSFVALSILYDIAYLITGIAVK